MVQTPVRNLLRVYLEWLCGTIPHAQILLSHYDTFAQDFFPHETCLRTGGWWVGLLFVAIAFVCFGLLVVRCVLAVRE